MWDFPLVHFNGCQCYCGSTSSSTWLWIVVGTRLMTHSSICKRHTHERGRGREGGREREGGRGRREGEKRCSPAPYSLSTKPLVSCSPVPNARPALCVRVVSSSASACSFTTAQVAPTYSLSTLSPTTPAASPTTWEEILNIVKSLI